MEQLAIQDKGTVQITDVKIDDNLDVMYKPGLYKQTEAFLNDNSNRKLLDIEKQIDNMYIYQKIAGVKCE